MNEKDCRRLVRGFQANLVAKRASGFRDAGPNIQSELRNRRWWPPRSAGRFTIPACIYAERASVVLARHAHALGHSVLLAELNGSRTDFRINDIVTNLVLLEYVGRDKTLRGHEYTLFRPYKAPLYRPGDGQPPWWEVLEQPERTIVTIGMATAHGPEHWRAS